jgi:quinolinate synthase
MQLEDYKNMSEAELIERINKAKKEKNAVVLVHSYQRLNIHPVADFLGDSLALAQEAAKTKADMIVFCGVDFMAESAKILSPDKKVILPDRKANCPMALMANGEGLRKLKEEHPGAVVITYINSSAEVKAESDVICTSSNAVTYFCGVW